MAIFNSFYTLTIPFVLLVSLPLLLTAVFTTFLATLLLSLRVVLIYMDLFIAVVPYYLSPFPHSSTSTRLSRNDIPYATGLLSPSVRRRRRSSSVSLRASTGAGRTLSSSSLTPVASSSQLLSSAQTPAQPISTLKSSISTSAILSSTFLYNNGPSVLSPPRDFEGVGGWRIGSTVEEGDDDESEALWTKINSRLELPADHGRRHKRSLTGGSINYGGLEMKGVEREDSAAVGRSSRSKRSTSPIQEREKAIAGGRARDREREHSNVGKIRTPIEEGSGNAGGYLGIGSGSSSPRSVMKREKSSKESERGVSTHTVGSLTSNSSGSSRGDGLSMKQKT